MLPFLLRRWRIDLLFAAYNTSVILSPAPVVLLTHNFNPYSSLRIPWSFYGRARHMALRLLGRLSAMVAHTVVFVSHSSARMIAPRLKMPTSRVRIVHHGWSPWEDSDQAWRGPDLELPERYILTVSDIQPHKNLEVLLDAFERLATTDGYPGHLLVVGGEKDMSSNYARHVLAVRDNLACSERIHFVGSLPNHMLPPVYMGAELFVFPSLEETFGMPLVEAMGSGLPLVVSDWRLAPGGEGDRLNVGPEICGGAAEFFEPTNAGSLVEAMRRVLFNPSRRAELIRIGQVRVKEFSWDKAAAALVSIFEEAAAVAD